MYITHFQPLQIHKTQQTEILSFKRAKNTLKRSLHEVIVNTFFFCFKAVKICISLSLQNKTKANTPEPVDFK